MKNFLILGVLIGLSLGQTVDWENVDLESNEIPANVKAAVDGVIIQESTVNIKVKTDITYPL